MAKNVITLTVTLNKEQAQRQIEEMKVGLKGMKDELSVVQNKLNDRDLWGPKDTFEGLKSREKYLTKEIKLTEKAIQTGVREIEGYENKLAHLSAQNYNTLTQMRTAYANSLKNIRKETDEDLAVYEEKAKALQSIRDEIAKRDIDVKGNMTVDKSKEVLTKPEDFSTRSINDAIEAMTKLRNIQQADSEEWHTYNNLIKQGSQYLEEFNSKIKTLDMSKVHEGVQTGNISDKDLNTVIRYWESMIEGADKSDRKLSEFNAKLEEARKLQQQRFQQKGESIVQEVKDGNLGGSLGEMQQRLKILQDYRNTIDSTKPDAFVEVDKAIGRITATIKEAQPGFMSFEAAMEKAADIKNFKGTIDELEKIKRTIQEGTTGLALKGKTLETLKEAQLRLDDIADKYKEIQHLNAQKKIDAVSNAMKSEEGLATLSAGDTEEAIRLAKELQKSHDTTGKEYQKLSVFITNAEAQLKKWNDSAKQTVMNKQLQDLTHLSKTALEEQQKFWQGAVNGAERGSQAYEYAAKRLQKVNDQMAVRQRSEANAVIKEINTDGNMGGSLSEMQQRLKLLQEYRTAIDSTKPNAYIEVDKAIASLNQRIKESQAGFMSFDEALEKAKAVAGGTFDGTVEDLEKIQKVLKEGMGEKKLDLLGQADLKEAHSGLDTIAVKLKEIANINAQDKIDAVASNIAAHSPAEIEEAVRLAKELQKSQGTSTRQYKELAVFITEAESQLKKWNDQVKQSFMQYDLSKVTSMSDASLAEQKNYWQEMVNGTEAGSAALQTYKNNLQTVIEEERKRTQAAGKDIVTQYKTGNWDKTIGETREAIKQLQSYRDTLRVTGESEDLQKIDKAIEGLALKTKLAEQGFLSLDEAMERVADIDNFDGTLEDLDKIQKAIKEGMSTQLNLLKDEDVEKMKMAQLLLDDISKKQKEIATLSAQDKISAVSANLDGSSVGEIEETVKLAKELQKAYAGDSVEFQNLSKFIEEGTAKIDAWNARIERAAMSEQFKRLTQLSTNALVQQKKYWQDVFDNAEKGSAFYIQAERKLQAIDKEITNRESTGAGRVMNNMQDYSVSEIEAAIKATEKLRDAQKAGSAEYEIYAEEIKKAKEYLQSYMDLSKQVDMEDKWANLSSLSTNALAEQKKYWQEMVNGAQQGSRELTEYQKKLKSVLEEEQKRLRIQSEDIVANPEDYSVKEVNEAIKSTEQLRDAQKRGSDEWKIYNNEIENAKKLMDSYAQASKLESMEDRLTNISNASTASLAEQKKYWQEVIANTEKYNSELGKYQENLSKVISEERNRIQQSGRDIISDYQSGNWDKTIGETKEAIKQLEEYRNTLNTTTDHRALSEVDQVLSELTKNTKEAERGFISLQDALSLSREIKRGTFQGTITDLEQLKKRLQEIRDTEIKLNTPTAKADLIELNTALDNVDKKIDEVNRGGFDLEKILKNLNTASIKDLNRAAEELKKQIENTSTASGAFIERSARLREVNKKLEESKELWKEKENIITKTAKRLASYVLVYAGFNEIVGKLKEVVRSNLALSDSLADIQKTTGLTTESVAKLSDEINAIDTRSAQKELHDLAYEAGKLGLSAEEDVLAFVRAGNQLLVALGEDLGGAEAVRQLMKVNAVLGETQKLGVEKALLATGSAINEISQTSRASAGPISDTVKRIGAIGAASHLTMADLVALAGTADAMGQSAEVSGTAFNKFLGTLQSNTVDVAYALGLDPTRLTEMLKNEETAIYAIIEMFEKMNLMGEMADLSPIMKDLGSEGARMTQVLTTMAAGIDELKAQVFTSRKAFAEATSVTNEYNIKNESAAAIIERMGNNLKEAFTNSTVVGALTDFLQWLYYLPNALERNRSLLFTIRTLLIEIATVSLVKLIAMLGGGLTGTLKTVAKAWKMFNLEAANSILLGGDRHGLWQRNTLRALAFANGINKVKIAFAALGRVISTNPIFFIGTALALAISAFKQLTEETNKAAKAAAEHDAAIRKEQFELENLKLRIENANGANGERAALIQELNNKYGQYLGFMVTEENYLRNQEYIYNLLNAQIERSIALKMREKLLTNISDKYADQQLEAFQDMESILKEAKGIGEGGAKEAVSKLMENIKAEVESGSKDVDAVLHNMLMSTSASYKANIELLNKQVEAGLIGKDSPIYKNSLKRFASQALNVNAQSLRDAISDMMEIETKIADEAATATKLSTANIEALDKKVQDLKREEAMDILDKISNTTNINELTEYQSKLSDFIRQQKQDVSELIAKQSEINSLTFAEINELDDLNNKKAKGVNLTDEEIKRYEILQEKKAGSNKLTEAENKQLEEANAELGKLQNGLDAVESKLAAAGKLSLWGDGKTIKDADVNQLVSMYKKLESDGAKIRKGATESIQTSYWKGFEDQKEAIKWYYQEAKTIKDELETRGYNTSGHFLWKDGDKSKKNKAKEEYRAALAALEAYFNERETLIQKKGFEEGKTQVQINQDLERLQTEKLNDEIQLRKLLLDDYYKESTFNPSKYKGVISGTDYFKEKNLEYLAALRVQLEKWGVAMEDGMKKQLTDRMVKLSEQVLKLREKINKILLEDNFSQQVKQQYLDSLQELGLLFGLTEQELVDQDKQEGLRRLAYMREWAKESYNLNAQQLQSKVEQEKAFSSWRIGRSAEDYEALLIQLRKFHDDQEEADRKAAERRKKIFDNSEKGIQLQKAASSAEKIGEAGVKDREDNVKFWDRFKNMDLVTDDLIDEKQVEVAQAQLSLYQAKIDASQLYIDQIKREMEAEHMKARMAIAEAQNELNRKKMMHADTTQAEADLYAAKQYYESLKRQESLMTKDKEEEIAQARADQVEQYQNIADRYLAIEQNKINRMKEYTDAVVDFSYQMGEAAFGEVADRQEAGKQLIKSLLTTLKEHLQIKLTELAMEAMFAQQSNAMKGGEMIANLTASGMEAGATVAIEGVKATAKETGKLGWKGLIVGAAISAALSALLGVAMGALNKKKSEIASTTGASTGRLATGMLTYAQGNYPVLGNDGQVYNAKYEGSEMKTGVYGGGAHFGIFSEKKPEAIIDGDTTQRLILYHPDIWQSILTLSKTGRLDRGMRTFASGNMSDFASMDIQPSGDNASVNLQNEMMEQLRALMTANMTLLNKLATEGVHSRIDMYGEGGLYKSMKKAETFASKRGYR